MLQSNQLQEFIERVVEHGELEIGPNVQFSEERCGKYYGKYYGFSWVTGPMFGETVEELLEKMYKKATRRQYRPYKKIFILERERYDSGQYR